MPRLISGSGPAVKFWSIDCDGRKITVTTGPLGTRGRSKTTYFSSEFEAQSFYDRELARQLAAGYVEEEQQPPPVARLTSSTAQALLAALDEDPDDLGTLAALGDHLVEEGDPRGELIQVQLALEDPSRSGQQRRRLEQRESQLLGQHQREWLGELAPYLLDGRAIVDPNAEDPDEGVHEIAYQCQLVRGWLERVVAPDLSLSFAETLVRSPMARRLRELTCENWYYEEEPTEEQRRRYEMPPDGFLSLYPLLEAPWLANLRAFQIGETPDDTLSQSRHGAHVYTSLAHFRCYAEGAVAPKLVQRMPRLETLRLFANDPHLDELFGLENLTQLRILQVYHAWDYPLERLAANPACGRLTHLLLHPKANGAWNDDCPYIRREGVLAVLHSPHLGSLTHLQLRLTTLGDEGCRDLVDSGILRRLQSLDLRHGSITDAGAEILAGCADLAHLQSLDLSRNRLSDEGLRRLSRVVPQVVGDFQQTPEELARDDDPLQYLFEGDYE